MAHLKLVKLGLLENYFVEKVLFYHWMIILNPSKMDFSTHDSEPLHHYQRPMEMREMILYYGRLVINATRIVHWTLKTTQSGGDSNFHGFERFGGPIEQYQAKRLKTYGHCCVEALLARSAETMANGWIQYCFRKNGGVGGASLWQATNMQKFTVEQCGQCFIEGKFLI